MHDLLQAEHAQLVAREAELHALIENAGSEIAAIERAANGRIDAIRAQAQEHVNALLKTQGAEERIEALLTRVAAAVDSESVPES